MAAELEEAAADIASAQAEGLEDPIDRTAVAADAAVIQAEEPENVSGAAAVDAAAVQEGQDGQDAPVSGGLPTGRIFAIAEDGRGGYQTEMGLAALLVQPGLSAPEAGAYPEVDPASAGADLPGWELVRRAAWCAPGGPGCGQESEGLWPSSWQDGSLLDEARATELLAVLAAQLLYGDGDAAMSGWPDELAAWVRGAVIAETPAPGDGTLVGRLMEEGAQQAPDGFELALLDAGPGASHVLVALPFEAPESSPSMEAASEAGVTPEAGQEPQAEPTGVEAADEPSADAAPLSDEPAGLCGAREDGALAAEGAASEVSAAGSSGLAAALEPEPAGPLAAAEAAPAASQEAPQNQPDEAEGLVTGQADDGDNGTRIESVRASWITGDTVEDGDPSRLSLALPSDDPFFVRVRLEVAFSGQRDLQPGEVSIAVPKSLFSGRGGFPADRISLSVPADPEPGAQFSYSDLGDRCVMTNTAVIGAASTATFELSYRDVTPHMVVDRAAGYVSAPFFAEVTLSTPEGALQAESNRVDAAVDTGAQVYGARAYAAGVHEQWPASWPQGLMPEDPERFLYVDWYAWCGVRGSQAYSLEVAGDASAAGVPGAVLLGIDGGGSFVPGDGSAAASEPLSGLMSFSSSEACRHFYAAYPIDGLDLAAGGALAFAAVYTLTNADDGETSAAAAEAEAAYAPQSFQEPAGRLGLVKEGWGGSSGHGGAGRVGVYGSALNRLSEGGDVEARFHVGAVALGWPWTLGEGADSSLPGSYGQESYALLVDDSEVLLDTGAGEPQALGAGDYEVAGVTVGPPTVYSYERFGSGGSGYRTSGGAVELAAVPAGGWGYRRDGGRQPLTVEVLGLEAATGEWELMATLDFSGGACVSAAYGAASANGAEVTFPSGVAAWRAQVETSAAGFSLDAYPKVRLLASGAAGAAAREALSASGDAAVRILNRARASVSRSGAAVAEVGPRQGADRLEGARLAVRQSQSLGYENDPAARLVRLRFRAVVEEQTNIGDLSGYQAAVESGAVAAETRGAWYELLPAGVVPDLSSVALRDGDSVLDVRLCEDWRGTGRSLLVVEASLRPQPAIGGSSVAGLTGYVDAPTLTFDAVYDWEALMDEGPVLESVVAFASGNGSLGSVPGYQGEPDDPQAGRHIDSRWACAGAEEAMSGLDQQSQGPRFVYARSRAELAVDVSALASLTKSASVNGSGEWGDGLAGRPLNVFEGGAYAYRLRVANDDSSRARGIVLYDAIERHVPAEGTPDFGDAQWRGTLAGVDVSRAERAGAAPVVYYSEAEGLSPGLGPDGTLDLSDASVWAKMPDSPSEELLARVSAVAVDCSQAADGGPFTLEAGEALSVSLRMRAPSAAELAAMSGGAGAEAWHDTDAEDEAGLSGGGHAYNAAAVSLCQVLDDGSESARQVVRREYVKVGVVPFEVAVSKTWEDDDDRDGMRPASVTVRLYADGADTGLAAVLDESNGWSATFQGVPATRADGSAAYYTVVEDPVEGYASAAKVAASARGLAVRMTNRHDPETLSIAGAKLWDDAEDAAGARPSSVRVALYADGKRLREQTVSADAEGRWGYSFDGLYRYSAGREVSYTVAEEYVPGYATSYDGADIVNTYRPLGTLVVSKRVLGATPAASGATFSFAVSVTRPDGSPDSGWYSYVTSDGRSGAVPNTGSVELADGQTAVVSGVPSECSYRVFELPRPGFSQALSSGAEGRVLAGRASEASFVNSYSSSGSVVVRATKTLSGRALAAGQFGFELLDGQGEVVRHARCAADGAVEFGALAFTQADDGATLFYRVREMVPDDAANADGVRWADADAGQREAGGFELAGYTYDSHEEEVVVTVSDNGDGTLTAAARYSPQGALFANAYRAEGQAALVAWKTVQGSLPCDLHRAYGVPDADIEAAALASGRTAEEEGAEFLPGVLGVPWRYSFGLYGEDGSRLASAENDASGTVAFPAVAYTEADVGGTFVYIAREDVPDDAVLPDGTRWADASPEQRGAGGFLLDGVAYGGGSCAWRAAVSDNGDGTLSVAVQALDPATFEPTSGAPVIDNGLAPGVLTIGKGVEGEAADPGQLFRFHVALSGRELPDGPVEYEVRAVATTGSDEGEAQA